MPTDTHPRSTAPLPPAALADLTTRELGVLLLHFQLWRRDHEALIARRLAECPVGAVSSDRRVLAFLDECITNVGTGIDVRRLVDGTGVVR